MTWLVAWPIWIRRLRLRFTVPASASAQVWRGGPRSAPCTRLIGNSMSDHSTKRERKRSANDWGVARSRYHRRPRCLLRPELGAILVTSTRRHESTHRHRTRISSSSRSRIPAVHLRSATVTHMNQVGVRELRQNLSRYLVQVKAGESFAVTERGRRLPGSRRRVRWTRRSLDSLPSGGDDARAILCREVRSSSVARGRARPVLRFLTRCARSGCSRPARLSGQLGLREAAASGGRARGAA